MQGPRGHSLVTQLDARPRRWFLALWVVVALVAGALVLPTPKAEAACSGNAIVCENQLPGTPASEWDINGVGDTSIQGFATASSVNAGSKIDFKVSTDARAYSIKIYRLGWYQGNGAREVATVTPTVVRPQTTSCFTSTDTEIYDCGAWEVSASWNVPAAAVSGVYIARLIRTDTGGDSHIPFVVRNDGNTSQLLVQTSDQTWQAYNTYGGSNFYTGKDNGRAYKLSYNRPYATRGLAAGRDFLFSTEYPMIRYLEQNGYDTSYVAGLDVAADATLLTKHKTFMSVGHDEYWTAPQRKNVTSARDAGVNLAFMGGNDVYWKSRWEPSQDGTSTAGRTLVTYKDTWTKDNSYGSQGTYDPVEPTPTWRDPRFGLLDYGYGPENGLTGTQFQANSVDMAIKVSAAEGKLRLWRGTSLATMAAGSVATLSDHTVGYEANEDVDNGYRPAGLIDLSTTSGTAQEYLTDYGSSVSPQPFTHHLTTYRAPSGALVFSSGTIQWPWGLDSTHDGTATPSDPRMRQATANMLADGGVLPTTVAPGMVMPAPSGDSSPPSIAITEPGAGANIAQGSAITVKGTAADNGGGQVAGVEVSTDGGASFHPATGTTSWSYTGVLSGNGTAAVQARATDDSSRTSAAVTLSLTSPCPCSLFGVASPRLADAGDGDDLTLGTKFVPTRSGFITGIRFYKADANTGTHTGTLYSSGGSVLATGTFGNETSSGWQTLTFTSGVAVDAGTTYVAAYHAPDGHYSADTNFFKTTYSAGVLTAPGTAAVTNGVFGVGATFPKETYRQTNYWVDPVWSSTNDVPVLVNTYRPSAGATTVQVTTKPSVTFSRDVDPATVMMQMVDGSQNAVPGTVSYSSATRTATFDPGQGLAPSTPYTVTVNAGGLSSAVQWSFTTAASDSPGSVCPCTLFNEDDAPATAATTDTQRTSLGVAFTASSGGQIAGVRFWKSPLNTGTHTVALWSGGTKLAEATPVLESSSGWQEADFATPVDISAGRTYVAAYTAPNGRYGFTSGGLSAGLTSGPLSTPASAGRYTYGTDAPSAASTTNYFVDPVFLPSDSVPPVVRGISPGDKATSVPTGSHATVTFSTDVQPGTAQITLRRTSDGVDVPGTASNEAQASQVTFVPSNDLDPATGYTLTVKGARNLAGTAMSGSASSSFTTSGAAACPCSLLESTTQPTLSDSADTAPVTVGLKFSPTTNGFVTALRYYRDATNTGTHTGTLYSADGTKLATVTFADSGTGWQTANLSDRVPVTAGATYVAAYYAPNGHYSASTGFFTNDVVNNPLRSVAPGGVYTYSNGFPDQSYMATSYLVDVLFTTNDDGAPAVSGFSPADGATNVAPATAVTATFTAAVDPTTLTLKVTDPAGQLVGGQLAYDPATRTATFTTAGPLQAGTTYKAAADANSTSGTAMASPKTWTFTTADTQAPAVFSTIPAAGAREVARSTSVTATFARPIDPASLALGLKSTTAGVAVTGTTTWDAATNTATFKPAAALSSSLSYTASVRASSVSGTPMAAAQTWSFTTTDTTAPTVSSTVPSANATNVAPTTAVSATFAAPVDPASVRLTLKTAAGAAVTGTTAYDATTRRATLTPAAPLTGATSYTASITANNRSGVPMAAPKTWSFTTADGTAPTVTGTTPVDGATGVARSVRPTATFAAPITSSSLSLTLKTADGTAVAGSTTYNSTTRTATFTPSAALASSTRYTAAVTAKNASGVAMASPTTWSFTTVAQTYTLYTGANSPSATSASTTPTTLGVQFSSARAGSVTAIRYYASSANTGKTVKLWAPDGSVLGTATTTQTTAGWRTATFTTPVAVTASTTYTASYYAPVGRWSTTTGSYTSAFTNGPLTVPASGGVSGTGDVRPTSTSTTNYWVDVLVQI